MITHLTILIQRNNFEAPWSSTGWNETQPYETTQKSHGTFSSGSWKVPKHATFYLLLLQKICHHYIIITQSQQPLVNLFCSFMSPFFFYATVPKFLKHLLQIRKASNGTHRQPLKKKSTQSLGRHLVPKLHIMMKVNRGVTFNPLAPSLHLLPSCHRPHGFPFADLLCNTRHIWFNLE